jgi:cytochrome c biogenesis protein CcmG/thiol:disulfide interchange protein DsbE
VKSFQLAVLFLLPLILSGCTSTPSAGMVGETAPDFTITDSDHTVSLHDYRGKIVILNLWASWCPPCIEETPSLIRLQKRLGTKGVILGVSMDEDDSAYHRFLKHYGPDYITVRDVKKEAVSLYKPTAPPETYVIDASGKIRRKFLGAYAWDSDEFLQYLNKL